MRYIKNIARALDDFFGITPIKWIGGIVTLPIWIWFVLAGLLSPIWCYFLSFLLWIKYRDILSYDDILKATKIQPFGSIVCLWRVTDYVKETRNKNNGNDKL